MDSSKRFFLAVVLSIGLFFAYNLLFPTPKPAVTPKADSTAVAMPATTPAASAPAAPATATTVQTPGAVLPADSTADAIPAGATTPIAVRAETTIVAPRDSGARFVMSSIGAVPSAVVLNNYEDHARRGHPVSLSAGATPLFKYQLVTNGYPPIDLSTVPFAATRTGDVVTYQAVIGAADIAIRYTFVPDSYTVHVSGTVKGVPGNAYLVASLPATLPVTESDSSSDYQHFAYAYFEKRDGARNVLFSSLDPGEEEPVRGPITWVAAKTKYFVVALLAPKNGPDFAEAKFVGGARTSKVATQAAGTTVIPVQNGAFAFDMYTGPQALKRLQSMERNFHEVNPYGWAFLRGVLQPIATGVALFVLWMHERLSLSYGMVLVLLGILVRIVTWPLNQKTMRTQMVMQQLQPELQAVQEKYKDDMEKQRAEIMKVYAAHGMSPLSPLMGCLPMLLPMPVLFALFFVFQSTVEFRGVSFWWLPDLSSHDPYYILPILMGASMFALSWIGMRGMPPNPQAKMMSYVMPAIFLVFFFKIASGLNLYYTVQNIAALPQQWLVARSRSKMAGTTPAKKMEKTAKT